MSYFYYNYLLKQTVKYLTFLCIFYNFYSETKNENDYFFHKRDALECLSNNIKQLRMHTIINIYFYENIIS